MKLAKSVIDILGEFFFIFVFLLQYSNILFEYLKLKTGFQVGTLYLVIDKIFSRLFNPDTEKLHEELGIITYKINI